MINEPIQSETIRLKYKKNYGADVYITSVIEIGFYGFLIFVTLKRIWNDSSAAPIDLVFLKLLLAAFLHPIIGSIKTMRIQWQANDAHQRTNALKNSLKKKGVIPT